MNCQNCGANKWDDGKCIYCGTLIVKVPENVWPFYLVEYDKDVPIPDLDLRPGATVQIPPRVKVTLINPG